MFGIGAGELAVILVIAVVVLGPKRLPQLARQLGALVRGLKKIADSATQEVKSELGPDYADLSLKDLDPNEFIRRQLFDE